MRVLLFGRDGKVGFGKTGVSAGRPRTTELQPGPLMVYGDPQQLALVIGALLLNARTAMLKTAAKSLRVSTAEQNTRNQRRELKAAADRHGWSVASIFEDEGISGASVLTHL